MAVVMAVGVMMLAMLMLLAIVMRMDVSAIMFIASVLMLGACRIVQVWRHCRLTHHPPEAQTLKEKYHANGTDEQSRYDAQEGQYRLRQNVLGEGEDDDTEQKYADCVADRHGEAEDTRMQRRTSRTDQVSSHNRLAMPRRHGMGSAHPEGNKEHQHERDILVVQEIGEGVVALLSPGDSRNP